MLVWAKSEEMLMENSIIVLIQVQTQLKIVFPLRWCKSTARVFG